MKKILSILIVLTCLTGCDSIGLEQTVYDQCLRAKLFQICLDKLPSGPSSIVENGDWGDVVDECATAARCQSLRPISQVKPECRSSN